MISNKNLVKAAIGLSVVFGLFQYEPLPARGFAANCSLFTVEGKLCDQGFSDLIANPNNFDSWDKTPITYKFDQSFLDFFPDPGLQNQVRLAFKEWDNAFTTSVGAMSFYLRDSVSQPFSDIRSVALHEIGHVLGFGHSNRADIVNRNYLRDNDGSLTSQKANGGEVMNNSIMGGAYNHILSKDELNGFQFFYTKDINFEETDSTNADIIISSSSMLGEQFTAEGEPIRVMPRDSNDPSQGGKTLNGRIIFNRLTSDPIGFKTLGINWDAHLNNNEPISSIAVLTKGTNNPDPIRRFDGFSGEQFQNYLNFGAGVDNKDELVHFWNNPLGGPSPLIHVGLEQDVWDWTVDKSIATSATGQMIDVPLTVIHEWNNTIVGSLPTPRGRLDETPGIQTLIDVSVLARGIRLVNSDITSQITQIAFAAVNPGEFGLDDLNRFTFEKLLAARRLEFLPNLNLFLEPGEDFFIVLEGTENDLPLEIQQRGNFLLLNRPDLLNPNKNIFWYALSQTNEATVGTYSLTGTKPITGVSVHVPEPSSGLSLLVFGFGVLGWGLYGKILINRAC